jgi:hypothetical protein
MGGCEPPHSVLGSIKLVVFDAIQRSLRGIRPG